MGVFLDLRRCLAYPSGLPHARGGVSEVQAAAVQKVESSPRPWGCFPHLQRRAHWHRVFPTPVGVFPAPKAPCCATASLPHARGGVSTWRQSASPKHPSSPRPWGCFRRECAMHLAHIVFPTPVGVFLVAPCKLFSESCLPHARGGVSHPQAHGGRRQASSPRPWGCFFFHCSARRFACVFPTPVGVFPTP